MKTIARHHKQSVTPAVRGCCRFSGFTTSAYPLRVQAGVQCLDFLDSGLRRNDR